jgi:hypothetical protein
MRRFWDKTAEKSEYSGIITTIFQRQSWVERRSEELFFSEKNYSAVRHGELDPRLI